MERTTRLLPWIALVAVWILWGSTYLGIRMAVETMPPLLMAGVRYILAGGLMFAVLAPRIALPTRRQVGAAFIVGACLFLGGNGLLTVAEQEIPSGLAALIVATVPAWMVVIDAVVQRRRIAPSVLLSLVIGMAGVYLLVGGPGSTPHVGYALLILLCSVIWAAGSVYSRTAPLPPHPLMSAATQMLAGGVLLLGAGLATGETVDLAGITGRSLTGFIWLVGPGAIIAFTAYAYALRTLPAHQVATYAYVNPIVAVLLGVAVDGETLTTNIAVSGALIVVAVALIMRSRRTPPPAQDTSGTPPVPATPERSA